MNPTMSSTQPVKPQQVIRGRRSKQEVKKIVLLVVIIFIGLAIAMGAYLITQQQKTTSRATGAEEISCPVEGASCEWDAANVPAGLTASESSSYEQSQTYNYTIIDKTDSNRTIKTGTTTSTKVTFTPKINHTYVCKVVTVSKCGVCDEQSVEGTCSAYTTPTPTDSPTPTITSTPTLTPTPTITPSPTLTPTATPTPNPECGSTCSTDSECPNQHVCRDTKCILDKCAQAGAVCTEDKCSVIPPTATPTLTPSPTITPSPTATITPSPTPTRTPTPTLTLTPTPTLTNTPVPSTTATLTPSPTLTGQPTAKPTEVVLAQSNPTNTPEATTVPTIPSAGSSSGVYFMVIAGIVLASLLLVF